MRKMNRVLGLLVLAALLLAGSVPAFATAHIVIDNTKKTIDLKPLSAESWNS